jgi:DNA-binding NarL/FixJ family response regulator
VPRLQPIIRVGLVGSQRIVLDSLGHLFAGQRDLRVVREPGHGAAFALAPERPDIVLFDLDEADGEGAFEWLARTAATRRTIVLSITTDPIVSLRVFWSGAKGLVSKRESTAVLLTAIRKVHAGEAWLGRAMTAQILDLGRSMGRGAPPQGPALNARDRQLITLVGEGRRNADIARRLLASEATVRASLTAIYRKLGVTGRFDVMAYAAQLGLVDVRTHRRSRVSSIDRGAEGSVEASGHDPES